MTFILHYTLGFNSNLSSHNQVCVASCDRVSVKISIGTYFCFVSCNIILFMQSLLNYPADVHNIYIVDMLNGSKEKRGLVGFLRRGDSCKLWKWSSVDFFYLLISAPLELSPIIIRRYYTSTNYSIIYLLQQFLFRIHLYI